MKDLAVSNLSLFLSFALVMVSVGISMKEHLGLTKDVFYSVARAIIQLTIVGYILKYIFKINNTWLTIVITLLIIFNASWNANKRDPNPDRKLWQSFVALLVGTYITLGVLMLSKTIKLVPMQIIPITGMIAGNEMVAIGLCYKTLNESFHDQYDGRMYCQYYIRSRIYIWNWNGSCDGDSGCGNRNGNRAGDYAACVSVVCGIPSITGSHRLFEMVS